MNTVDPRWKNGIDFEDVNSLLHIMIRNKDTDVFLILTLPLYGTSSIRKRIRTPIYSGYLPETFSTHCRFMEHLPSENGSNTDLFRIPTGDVFHTLPFYGTSSIRKRIRTPIYSAANYEYILITIFMITQLNSVYFGFTSGAGVL